MAAEERCNVAASLPLSFQSLGAQRVLAGNHLAKHSRCRDAVPRRVQHRDPVHISGLEKNH